MSLNTDAGDTAGSPRVSRRDFDEQLYLDVCELLAHNTISDMPANRGRVTMGARQISANPASLWRSDDAVPTQLVAVSHASQTDPSLRFGWRGGE
jgi:hypothetical protein